MRVVTSSTASYSTDYCGGGGGGGEEGSDGFGLA